MFAYSGKRVGGIFCVCFKGFEGGKWMEERVNGFFYSLQNEEIWGLMWIIVFLPKYPFACILLQYIKLNII